MLGNRGQKVSLPRTVAEILSEMPQLSRQLPVFVVLGGSDLLLGGKLPVPQEIGCHDGGVYPSYQRTAWAERRAPLGNAEPLLAEPKGVVLPADRHALAALAKLFLHKGRGGGPGGVLLEESHDAFYAVLPVASAGQGAANDRFRHLFGENGHLPLGLTLLGLSLGNALHLLLHRGKQVKRRRGGPLRRRNGGLSARRLFLILIYRYTISFSTISSACCVKLFTACTQPIWSRAFIASSTPFCFFRSATIRSTCSRACWSISRRWGSSRPVSSIDVYVPLWCS